MSNLSIAPILQKSSDPQLIERAFRFASEAHRGQKRLSGEDYIVHPLAAAHTLSEMDLDSATIAAALLHDVADDTDRTLEDIEKEFGKEIAFLVSGVSKLGQLRLPKEDFQIPPAETRKEIPIDPEAENLRKMFFAMAEDLRVIFIKLADRLHNMQTLNALPPQRQQRISLETMEIYAPIAERLGIGEMKGQLEDLAFPYVYPKEYEWLMKNIKEKYEERMAYLQNLTPVVRNILKEEQVPVNDINSRAKHYWSLYQKLLRHDMNVEKIYDLAALRIIVPNVELCYKTLGCIHKLWRPLPRKIQDFISLPKPNGYQGLHTTCFCPEGKLTEFQIKTPEMHAEAEYGICAHWAYKQRVNSRAQRRKLAWVAQLRDWQKETSRAEDFWEGLKIDFFRNRIFVFTPRGDIVDLPEGATPVDFAYAIHTDIGNRCAGAKIHGKMAALDTPLQSGDVVEILTDKNRKPARDWLEFAQTNAAKAKIREWIKKESRPEHIQKGMALLNRDFRQLQGVSFLHLSEEKKKLILKLTRFRDMEDLAAAVGSGELSPGTVVRKLFQEEDIVVTPAQRIRLPQDVKEEREGIALAGQTGILIKLAKCCFPQPGDTIAAYITRARGASVHAQTCSNLTAAKQKWPQKIVEATWQESSRKLPNTISLRVYSSEDRVGLLRDISNAVSEAKTNIISCHTELSEGSAPIISLRISVATMKQLESVFRQLRRIQGIRDVKRV